MFIVILSWLCIYKLWYVAIILKSESFQMLRKELMTSESINELPFVLGIEAFTTISITFLNEHLEFDATEVGILFCIVLIAAVPGAYVGFWLTEKLNPLTAMKVQQITFVGLILVHSYGLRVRARRLKRMLVE